jgi:hypothetical protein
MTPATMRGLSAGILEVSLQGGADGDESALRLLAKWLPIEATCGMAIAEASPKCAKAVDITVVTLTRMDNGEEVLVEVAAAAAVIG